MNDRDDVLNALRDLSLDSWVIALSAARGVLQTMGDCINPDPTRDYAAVTAIDAQIKVLAQGKGTLADELRAPKPPNKPLWDNGK